LRLRVEYCARQVERNYRMILIADVVTEVSRGTHDVELKAMARVFADVKTTDEMVALLAGPTQRSIT